MQKRSYLIVVGLAVLVGVGVSLRFQHKAADSFGQNAYLVAESDGYDDAYGSDSSSTPSEDSGTTTDTGTTDSGTSNDDYSSEDF